MTALVFILGILIILGIARYNESNKLFWILFTAYVLGFTGTKVLIDTFAEKEQSGQSLNQAYPTQGSDMTLSTNMCFITSESLTAHVKGSSKPVGQVMPEYIEYSPTLSDVFGVTQGLYLHILPNPPNNAILYDTS